MKKTALLLIILTLVLSACKSGSDVEETDLSKRTIRVVATTSMIADMVRHIGGKRVNVTTLIGPGLDPHLYKANEDDIHTLREADVIFYNGLQLEVGLADTLEQIGNQVNVVAVAESAGRPNLIPMPEFEGAYDPHVWLDVALWMNTTKIVQTLLVELDPQHAEWYRINEKTYLTELDALNNYVQTRANELPKEQRILITTHDAFKYFGRAYGFDVYALIGTSTEFSSITPDTQALADLIVEKQIPVIFTETSIPSQNIDALQTVVQAKGFDVQLGNELFSDTMGEPNTEEGTYSGMIKYNIDTIVSALEGK